MGAVSNLWISACSGFKWQTRRGSGPGHGRRTYLGPIGADPFAMSDRGRFWIIAMRLPAATGDGAHDDCGRGRRHFDLRAAGRARHWLDAEAAGVGIAGLGAGY